MLFLSLLILPIFIGCAGKNYYNNKKMYKLYVEKINTANSRKLYTQSLKYYKYWVDYCGRKSSNREGFEKECNQMEKGYHKLRNDMASGKKVDPQEVARNKKRKEKSDARYKYYEAKMSRYEDSVTKDCRDIEQGFPVVGSDGKTIHGSALKYWYKSHNCKQR